MNRQDMSPSDHLLDYRRAGGLAVIDLTADDLPCPWCGEATDVADTLCRGCGRRFG
ncbi:MAG TPA: hypothetical protein VLB67_05545 [Acidimicrobiia bacterium]|nr:hypothetical protein [Acidimicrobiia bacterium]